MLYDKDICEKLVSDEDFCFVELYVKKYAQRVTIEKIDSYKSLKNKQRKLIGEMLAFKGLVNCFKLKNVVK